MSRQAEKRDARDRPITRRMRHAMEAEEAREQAPKRKYRVLEPIKSGGRRLIIGEEFELDEITGAPLVAKKVIEAITPRKARATDKA